MLPHLFYATNVIDEGLVEASLIEEYLEIVCQEAVDSKLIGGTSTSLEEAGTEVSYRLMDGRLVAEFLPRLHQLYHNEFLSIAQRVFNVDLMTSPDVINGANVNLLDRIGRRYEWHYDSNPYTGLLALSPSSTSLGGRLLFGRDSDRQVALSMRPGDLFFFDAREAAHAVEPIARPRARATVPMNYFVKGEAVVRPSDLDQTLYG